MQLTSYENLTKDKILFHEVKEFEVKNSKLKYQRINIETNLPNGKKALLRNRNSIIVVVWNHRKT